MPDASDAMTELRGMGSLALLDCSKVDLPTDIFVVVAEILAGDFAFGTLAHLNLANHDIRDETLPVLYETVMLDQRRITSMYAQKRCNRMPAAFRYTKFLIFRGSHMELDVLISNFPRLCMLVVLSETAAGPNTVDICVYKPLKCSTVFGMTLRTPIHHTSFVHCQCEVRRLHGRRERGIKSAIGTNAKAVLPACQVNAAKPLVRCAETIRHIKLELGGRLLNDCDWLLKTWNTSIRLHGTQVGEFDIVTGTIDADAYCETLLGLLFLHLMDLDSEQSFALDQRLSAEFGAPATNPRCYNTLPYVQWHISLAMTKDMSCLFLQKFDAATEGRPRWPCPRLKVLIQDSLGGNEFMKIVHGFTRLYDPQSLRRLYYGIGSPYTLLALATGFGRGMPRVRYVCNLQLHRQGNHFEPVTRVVVEQRPGVITGSDYEFGIVEQVP